MFVVEIVRAVLKKNVDGPNRTFANHAGIEIAAWHHRLAILSRPIANRCIAADHADDFPEYIGTMPCDGECADGAAAGTTDGALLGIVGQAVLRSDERKHLLDQE